MATKILSQCLPEVQLPNLAIVDGVPRVSSLDITEKFGKPHKDVLEAIRRIIADLPKDFHKRNFSPMSVDVKIGNGAVRKSPAYSLTRDAFSLVVMGFTGKEALAWKVRYIEAFNTMEASLRSPASLPSVRSRAYTLPAEPYLRLNTAQMQALRSAHKAWAEEVTYNDRFKGGHATWLILKGHFGGVTRLDDLPADWFLDLIEFCHEQQEKELARRRARREMPKPRVAPALPPVPPTPQPNYDVPWGDVPKAVSDAARQAAQVALPLNNARHTALALACLIEQARENLDALRALSALEVK